MRTPSIRLIILSLTALIGASTVRAATINFNVIPAQSDVTVTIMLDTPVGADTDSDMSAVSGLITADLEAISDPFGEIHITNLSVATTEPTALNFCFVQIITCLAGVNVTSGAGDINVVMDTPGAPAQIVGGDFTQTDNDMRMLGSINVDATGLADGQIPEGPFLIDSDPLPNDLSGTIVRNGDLLTLTIDLVADGIIDDPDTGVTTEYSMTGTIVATANAPLPMAGDLDCSGTVDLDDAPLLVEALLAPGSFSGCDIARADVDANGVTNGLDVAAFVAAVLGA